MYVNKALFLFLSVFLTCTALAGVPNFGNSSTVGGVSSQIPYATFPNNAFGSSGSSAAVFTITAGQMATSISTSDGYAFVKEGAGTLFSVAGGTTFHSTARCTVGSSNGSDFWGLLYGTATFSASGTALGSITGVVYSNGNGSDYENLNSGSAYVWQCDSFVATWSPPGGSTWWLGFHANAGAGYLVKVTGYLTTP